jgi:hypothetical protein
LVPQDGSLSTTSLTYAVDGTHWPSFVIPNYAAWLALGYTLEWNYQTLINEGSGSVAIRNNSVDYEILNLASFKDLDSAYNQGPICVSGWQNLSIPDTSATFQVAYKWDGTTDTGIQMQDDLLLYRWTLADPSAGTRNGLLNWITNENLSPTGYFQTWKFRDGQITITDDQDMEAFIYAGAGVNWFVDCTSKEITVLLPKAGSLGVDGTRIMFKKTDSTRNKVILKIAASSGDLIDTESTYEMTEQNQSVIIVAQNLTGEGVPGNFWRVVAEGNKPVDIPEDDDFPLVATIGRLKLALNLLGINIDDFDVSEALAILETSPESPLDLI